MARSASGEESAPISISAALPGSASSTRKMIREAPASVASRVRRRRRIKTLTRRFPLRRHRVNQIASPIIRSLRTAFNRVAPGSGMQQTQLSAGPSRRPTIERILRRFEQRANPQQLNITAKLSHQLEADRQPVGAEATGYAHRRMPGHVEGHSPGKPVRPDIAKYFAIDFDRTE